MLNLPTVEFSEKLKKIYESGEVAEEEEEEKQVSVRESDEEKERPRRSYWAYSFRSLLEVC